MEAILTVHLNLSDFRLEYFVYSSVSMNPSQGIYGGKGSVLVNRLIITY